MKISSHMIPVRDRKSKTTKINIYCKVNEEDFLENYRD